MKRRGRDGREWRRRREKESESLPKSRSCFLTSILNSLQTGLKLQISYQFSQFQYMFAKCYLESIFGAIFRVSFTRDNHETDLKAKMEICFCDISRERETFTLIYKCPSLSRIRDLFSWRTLLFIHDRDYHLLCSSLLLHFPSALTWNDYFSRK